jgi:hypothetical protein
MGTSIQVGDFIKSSLNSFMCGIVVSIGAIQAGRDRIPAYRVRLANGRIDVIAAEDAIFIAR